MANLYQPHRRVTTSITMIRFSICAINNWEGRCSAARPPRESMREELRDTHLGALAGRPLRESVRERMRDVI